VLRQHSLHVRVDGREERGLVGAPSGRRHHTNVERVEPPVRLDVAARRQHVVVRRVEDCRPSQFADFVQLGHGRHAVGALGAGELPLRGAQLCNHRGGCHVVGCHGAGYPAAPASPASARGPAIVWLLPAPRFSRGAGQ
jgi:hypothetical protein